MQLSYLKNIVWTSCRDSCVQSDKMICVFRILCHCRRWRCGGSIARLNISNPVPWISSSKTSFVLVKYSVAESKPQSFDCQSHSDRADPWMTCRRLPITPWSALQLPVLWGYDVGYDINVEWNKSSGMYVMACFPTHPPHFLAASNNQAVTPPALDVLQPTASQQHNSDTCARCWNQGTRSAIFYSTILGPAPQCQRCTWVAGGWYPSSALKERSVTTRR